MTTEQYLKALKKLDLTPAGKATLPGALGLSRCGSASAMRPAR